MGVSRTGSLSLATRVPVQKGGGNGVRERMRVQLLTRYDPQHMKEGRQEGKGDRT